MQAILRFLKGYVKIRIYTDRPFRFLNQCGSFGIYLWNIGYDSESCSMYLYLKDFYKLKPIVKRTKSKVVLSGRYGLPFLLHTILNKKVFLIAGLITIWLWIFSGNYLWEIETFGNCTITDEMLMDYLETLTILPGIRQSNINIEQIEKGIRKQFEPVTWVSMKLQGTKLLIYIKENDTVTYDNTVPITEGTRILASTDGMIRSIIVRSGVPFVKPGDSVAAGQILVDGNVPVYDINGNLSSYKSVVPDADIILRCDIPYEYTLSNTYHIKQYTGRTATIPYVILNNHEYHLPFTSSYLKYDIVKEEDPGIFLFSSRYNFRLGTYKLQEYYLYSSLYKSDEVKEIMKTELQKNIYNLEEKGVQIIEKNVKIYKSASLYVAKGSITVDLPLNYIASFAQD